MKKYLTLVIAVFLMSNIVFGVHAKEVKEREITAKSAILMDQETGRVLWKKNADKKIAMASTTKIMTCMIALEYGDFSKDILVSKRAQVAPKVKLYIKEGELYKLEDLLYALMLESSNDVAIAVAEGVSGSVEEFCKLMTDKAKKIGADQTTFITPNGLDAEGHSTTAYDLALITKYALENEQFVNIINKASHSFSEVNNKRSFTVNNKNAFLHMYQGAYGVKTGYTGNAGYCFVGCVKKDGLNLITVVLGSGWPPQRTYRWRDTTTLMNYGFDNYHYKTILSDKKIIAKIEDIRFAIEDELEGLIAKDLKIICKDNESVDIIYHIYPIQEAPIASGDKIGEALIYLGTEPYTRIDILASKDVERMDYTYCLNYVLKRFF